MTFLELAGFYLEGISELAKIEGITYRDGDQIQENPWRGITDLSTIPFVYKDLKKIRKPYHLLRVEQGLSVLLQLLSLLDRQETAVPGSGTGQRGITVFPGS